MKGFLVNINQSAKLCLTNAKLDTIIAIGAKDNKLNLNIDNINFDYSSASFDFTLRIDCDLGSGISNKILGFLTNLIIKLLGGTIKSQIENQAKTALNNVAIK